MLLEMVKEKGTVTPSPASGKQPLDVLYTVTVSCDKSLPSTQGAGNGNSLCQAGSDVASFVLTTKPPVKMTGAPKW